MIKTNKNKNKNKIQSNLGVIKKSAKPFQKYPTFALPAGEFYQVDKVYPSYSYQGQGTIRVRHRELLSQIQGNSNGATGTWVVPLVFPINPGVDVTFTWLSQLGILYETYKINKLRFSYIPFCATSQVGGVYLGIDYDPLDATPISKAAFLSLPSTMAAPAWQGFCLEFDPRCVRPYAEHYVRDSIVTGSDLKTYDCGNLFVGLDGFANSNQIGDLYIEYDISFYQPQIPSQSAANVSQEFTVSNSGTGVLTPSTILTSAGDNIAYTVASAVPGQGLIKFNEYGDYLVNLYVGGNSTNTVPSCSGFTNCSIADYVPLVGAAGTGMFDFIVRVDDLTRTLTLALSTLTAVTANRFRVSKYYYPLG